MGASDAKWEMAETDMNGAYHLINRYPDKRANHYLSYGGDDLRVGLWNEKKDAAKWQLVECSVNGRNAFKLKCFYDGDFKGWLSYRNKGKWNHLYSKESDACVYV